MKLISIIMLLLSISNISSDYIYGTNNNKEKIKFSKDLLSIHKGSIIEENKNAPDKNLVGDNTYSYNKNDKRNKVLKIIIGNPGEDKLTYFTFYTSAHRVRKDFKVRVYLDEVQMVDVVLLIRDFPNVDIVYNLAYIFPTPTGFEENFPGLKEMTLSHIGLLFIYEEVNLKAKSRKQKELSVKSHENLSDELSPRTKKECKRTAPDTRRRALSATPPVKPNTELVKPIEELKERTKLKEEPIQKSFKKALISFLSKGSTKSNNSPAPPITPPIAPTIPVIQDRPAAVEDPKTLLSKYPHSVTIGNVKKYGKFWSHGKYLQGIDITDKSFTLLYSDIDLELIQDEGNSDTFKQYLRNISSLYGFVKRKGMPELEQHENHKKTSRIVLEGMK
jgi:hypothetical protein